jgi:hypothetical protein
LLLLLTLSLFKERLSVHAKLSDIICPTLYCGYRM